MSLTSAGQADSGRRLVIFGAWNFSHCAAEAAQSMGWSVAGFVDPEPPADFQTLPSVPEDAAVFAAIGDNALRMLVCDTLGAHGRSLVSVIHASAVVSPSAVIGDGCYLGENAVVRANAVLGKGVLLNAGAVVSHDCRVGDFVAMGPNAAIASRVSLGSGSLLGVGASARPGARVGRDCIVGAGAAVIQDIDDGLTALGVPARPASRRPDTGKQSDWASNAIW